MSTLLRNLILILLLARGAPLAAGAWLLAEGDQYASVWFGYSTSRSYWDRDGRLKLNGCRSHNEGLTYTYERGLSYDYTFLMKAGAKRTHCGTEANEGLGDMEIGIRGRTNPYKSGRAWEARVIIPTGYGRREPRRLGFGRLALDLAVLRGDSLGNRSYIEWAAGARIYEGAPAHQWRVHVQRGFPLSGETAKGNIRLQGIFTMGNGRPEKVVLSTGERQAEFDLVKVSVEAKNRIWKDWSAAVGASLALWGRSTGLSHGFSLSFSRSF